MASKRQKLKSLADLSRAIERRREIASEMREKKRNPSAMTSQEFRREQAKHEAIARGEVEEVEIAAQTGKRGGRFYLTAQGKKVYIKS